ncbi:hypothetical protein V5O48_011826 [Marasmius crinis-equi]|uniref:F-box domain-containing protein n=1 Tax=Marasmius crinis-equi TaxID=585013 RepID=A0ABR3F4F8_9AGAR
MATGYGDSHNTLEEFDEQIKKAKREVKELEYRRNLRVPICRLPVEILGRIFMFSTFYDSWAFSRAKFPKVMHVCRLWRTIAQNTPSMWSKPLFTRPTVAREMMKYSKSAPLDIEWGSYGYGDIQQKHFDLLLEAVEQPSRVSSLVLHCQSSDLTRLLSRLVHSTPSIHRLSLEVMDDGFYVPPDNFLGGDAPRLTDFETRGCGIPWGSPILKNLTRFSITRSCSPSAATSLEQVAASMQAMTALEELNMADFITSHSNIALSDNVKVVLPRLKNMRLSSRGMAVATLLYHMSFPDTTVIHLEIPQLDDAQDLLANYLSGLFSDTQNGTHPRTIRTLHILRGSGYNLELVAHGGSLSSPFRFQCQIGKETWSDPLPIKQRLLDGLGPLTSLEALYTSCFLPQDTLFQRFGNLPVLQRIDVSYESELALEVVKSLAHNLFRSSMTTRKTRKGQNAKSKAKATKVKKRSTTQPIVYPALEILAMSEVDFSDLVDPLIDSLRSRSEHASSVKVILENCTNLYSDDFQRIKDQVDDDIDWDGIETDGVETEEECVYDPDVYDYDGAYDSDQDYYW